MQLSRFLKHAQGFEVRVAGYRDELCDIDADYTLDSMLEFYGQNASKSIQGKNFERYLQEIDTYKPDLIISDLEFFTSFAANELSIPYWIVSSFALYLALPKQLKDALGIARHYRNVLQENKNFHRYNYQLSNADRSFIYSPFGDLENAPKLKDDFYWTRPYYMSEEKESKDPRYVSVLSITDKPLIKMVSKLGLTKYYSFSPYENIYNHFEIDSPSYGQDVTDALLLISTGETSFVADAIYNKKYSLIYPNYKHKDSIVNSRLVEYLKIGEKIYTRKSFEQIYKLVNKNIQVKLDLNSDIKYLHEHIQDLI